MTAMQVNDLDVLEGALGSSRGSRRGTQLPGFLARPVAMVRAVPDAATYAGIVLLIAGFALLAVAWGKVAGLTAVPLQLPYLASAGFTGLALVVCGVGLVSAAARAKDGAVRRDQLRELTAALTELKTLLDEDGQR